MSDAKGFLEELFGGSVPNGVRVGSIQDLIDDLGGKCESDECPFHGERNQARKAADEELSSFTSKDLFDFALGATAGAEQALRAGRYQVAEARQTQASLWMELQERLDREETIERRLDAQAEKWNTALQDSEQQVRDLRSKLTDANADKEELRTTVTQLENAIKDSNGA